MKERKSWEREERRKKCRVNFSVSINCDRSQRCRSLNLSESGMCIATEKEFEVSSFVTLAFELDNNVSIKTHGIIVWSKKISAAEFTHGIKFWHLDRISQKRLKEFIEKQTASG